MLVIVYANLTVKNASKLINLKGCVLLSDAKFYKGMEIIKIQVLKELGEPNQQLTKEEYESIHSNN
jgi:hypothetical protein